MLRTALGYVKSATELEVGAGRAIHSPGPPGERLKDRLFFVRGSSSAAVAPPHSGKLFQGFKFSHAVTQYVFRYRPGLIIVLVEYAAEPCCNC